MDIDMTKFRLDAIGVAFYEAHSLSVVTLESFLGMKRKADIATEAIPILRFDASG